MNFSSKCFLSNVEEINSLLSCFKKSKKEQKTKIANNQLKCSIIYKTIMMRAGDDEQRINYEWPKSQRQWLISGWLCCPLNSGPKLTMRQLKVDKKKMYISLAISEFKFYRKLGKGMTFFLWTAEFHHFFSVSPEYH